MKRAIPILTLLLAVSSAYAETLLAETEVTEFGEWMVSCSVSPLHDEKLCSAHPREDSNIVVTVRQPPFWASTVYWAAADGTEISVRLDDSRVRLQHFRTRTVNTGKRVTKKAKRIRVQCGDVVRDLSVDGLSSAIEFLQAQPIPPLRNTEGGG